MSLFLSECIHPLLFILFYSLLIICIYHAFFASVLLSAKRISIICSDALKGSCTLEKVLVFKFYSVCDFFFSTSTFNNCTVWFGFIFFSIVELFVFLKPALKNSLRWQPFKICDFLLQ